MSGFFFSQKFSFLKFLYFYFLNDTWHTILNSFQVIRNVVLNLQVLLKVFQLFGSCFAVNTAEVVESQPHVSNLAGD